MLPKPFSDPELTLLEEIEHDPNVTQASLAIQLGVAVGKVNFIIKRLISKGYVKVSKAQRRKLRYIITPEGLAFRANLAVHYIETSLTLYRKTRLHVRDLLSQAHQAGYDQVVIVGDGDIADICRLTCMEQDVRVIEAGQSTGDGKIPALEVQGTKVYLQIES
jgi:DNA-binding MarR family transcriptional regulator